MKKSAIETNGWTFCSWFNQASLRRGKKKRDDSIEQFFVEFNYMKHWKMLTDMSNQHRNICSNFIIMWKSISRTSCALLSSIVLYYFECTDICDFDKKEFLLKTNYICHEATSTIELNTYCENVDCRLSNQRLIQIKNTISKVYFLTFGVF